MTFEASTSFANERAREPLGSDVEQPDLVRRYRRHAIDAARGIDGAERARADTVSRMSKVELARGMRLVREALSRGWPEH